MFAAAAVYFLGWARGSRKVEDDPVNQQLRIYGRAANYQTNEFARTRNRQHLGYARKNLDLMDQTAEEAEKKTEAGAK